MGSGDQILSQEDVDALLNGGGETDDDAGSPSAQAAPVEEPDKKVVTASVGRSESEIRELLDGLRRKAHIQRDRGVKVIWNAIGLFPLTPGYNMEIQGRNYVTLGSLSNTHLVVGLTEA